MCQVYTFRQFPLIKIVTENYYESSCYSAEISKPNLHFSIIKKKICKSSSDKFMSRVGRVVFHSIYRSTAFDYQFNFFWGSIIVSTL